MRPHRWLRRAGASLALFLVLGTAAAAGDESAQQRARMVRAVEAMFAETASMTGRGNISQAVRDAIAAVPRDEFVPERMRAHAYANRALPIGEGQTISQPYVVALMTDLLDVGRGDRVLEIGTGSGYQAAVLARLFDKVFSTERIGELARAARQRMHGLKIHNVYTRHADGLDGWPSQAPFDAILVTAGGRVPKALLDQLGEGGVLVAPVGDPGGRQELVRYARRGDEFESESLGAVTFVPLLQGLD